MTLRRGIEQQALTTAVDQVRQALQLAKGLALESPHPVCVHFTLSRLRVTGGEREEEVHLPGSVRIARTTFRIGRQRDRVCFSSLGAPSPAGSVFLRGKSGAERVVIVSVGVGRIRTK